MKAVARLVPLVLVVVVVEPLLVETTKERKGDDGVGRGDLLFQWAPWKAHREYRIPQKTYRGGLLLVQGGMSHLAHRRIHFRMPHPPEEPPGFPLLSGRLERDLILRMLATRHQRKVLLHIAEGAEENKKDAGNPLSADRWIGFPSHTMAFLPPRRSFLIILSVLIIIFLHQHHQLLTCRIQ